MAGINLKNLQQGVVPVSTPGQNAEQAQLVSAIVNVQPRTDLVQVAQPTDFSSINLQSLQSLNDDTFQGTLKNESGATRQLIIGGLFSLQGEYQAYNLQPSAVDFATVLEITSDAPSNTGIFQGLNKRLKEMPAIFSQIILQTSVASQSNMSIKTGYITKSNNLQENTVYAPVCDSCQNNNLTLFTRTFNGAFMAGKNSYIKIPVVNMPGAGDFLTIRLEYAGEAQVSSMAQQNMV